MNRFKEYCLIVLGAVIMACNYHMFVLPNSFAPAGLNGLATMVQYLFDFSIGYISLLINIPLCIFAFFHVNRDYACKTGTFAILFSVLLILFRLPIFDFLVYQTTYSQIIGPIVSGIVAGFVYGILFRRNGSTGGMDIIAAYVHRVDPKRDIFQVILTLNCAVAVISYFVYGFAIEPVILCIAYCYFTSFVGNRMIKGGREVVKFEVITEHGEDLSRELMSKMHRGVTLLPATGMYSHREKNLLVCVVDKRQVVNFINITQKYPNTFTCASSVIQTVGNFASVKT